MMMFFGLQGNRPMARDVLLRCLQVAVLVGLALGVLLLVFRHNIPTIFTRDPEVAAWAAATLPILAFMMVSVLLLNRGIHGHNTTTNLLTCCLVLAALS